MDTPESYFSPIFTKRDSSEKELMSPSDKPTGEVTDAVDPDGFGGSSTDGLSSSTGNVTGNLDIDHCGGGNTNGPGSSYSSLATSLRLLQ